MYQSQNPISSVPEKGIPEKGINSVVLVRSASEDYFKDIFLSC